MAHELYEKQNGEHAMVYHGERPWHGLGKALSKPFTAEEAITEAGLDYAIETKPLHAKLSADKYVDIPKRRAVVNTENDAILGIVSPHYKVIQNREAFGFFDSIVGEGQAIYHTAGALGKGEKVWLLAKLPDDLKTNAGDIDF